MVGVLLQNMKARAEIEPTSMSLLSWAMVLGRNTNQVAAQHLLCLIHTCWAKLSEGDMCFHGISCWHHIKGQSEVVKWGHSCVRRACSYHCHHGEGERRTRWWFLHFQKKRNRGGKGHRACLWVCIAKGEVGAFLWVSGVWQTSVSEVNDVWRGWGCYVLMSVRQVETCDQAQGQECETWPVVTNDQSAAAGQNCKTAAQLW